MGWRSITPNATPAPPRCGRVLGDARVAADLVGLSDGERSGGGDADPEVVARWLDDGVVPSGGECGRAHGKHAVHGFDLTFFAPPKSVSLVRVFGDDVIDKAVSVAHQTAIGEALEYLSAHAGYTRVHNPITGEKKICRSCRVWWRRPTSMRPRGRGDPHLHTHVLVPNRQARADGRLVSIDGTSLFHEARAAGGIIYQATLRHELHRLAGIEWGGPVDPATGMAEIAGIDPKKTSPPGRREAPSYGSGQPTI